MAVPAENRLQRVAAYLTGPRGTLRPASVSFSNALNRGIQWNAELQGEIHPDWDDEAEWQIRLEGAGTQWGASWESCPLVASQVEPDNDRGAQQTTISGTDLASFRLAAEGATLPTYERVPLATIVGGIGTAGRVSVGVSGNAAEVPEYDVQGGTLGSHLSRLAGDFGNVLRVNQDPGQVQVLMERSTIPDAPPRTIYISHVRHRYNRAGRPTQVLLKKTNKAQAQFVFPFDSTGVKTGDLGAFGLIPSSIQIFDESLNGPISYVAFYSEPGGAGNLLALFYINPQYIGAHGPVQPFGGDGMAGKSLVCAVELPPRPDLTGTVIASQLRVTGIPAGQSGYDVTFETKWPESDTSARKRLRIVESPLWPTQAFADSIRADVWREATKDEHVIAIDALLDPYVRPGMYAIDAARGLTKTKLEEVAWTVSSRGVPTFTLTGSPVD